MTRVTNAVLIESYARLRNVWAVGREVGHAGQYVWRRLRAAGVEMSHPQWTEGENEKLRGMVGQVSIGQMADELGRSYTAVACQLGELGLSAARPRARKLPRGEGWDKATTVKRMTELEARGDAARKYAQHLGVNLDSLVYSFQKHCPDRWLAWTKTHSPVGERICGYCNAVFYPMGGRQRSCTRQCQTESRTDARYFGGKRRNTVGLAERQCQLCRRTVEKGLSSHHVLGKANDPDNECLVALCQGCHHLVGHLAGRNFIDTDEGWEELIHLALARRNGHRANDVHSRNVCVEVEELSMAAYQADVETHGEWDEEDEVSNVAG